MMSRRIWYVSKYVSPPANASAGGRGYMIMRELADMGHECVIITSDSNQLAQVPSFDGRFLIQKVDGLAICWIRTLKYKVAKSPKRILSWLDFEWKLWILPKKIFPRPDVVIISSLSLLTIINGFWLKARYKCRLIFEIRDIWPLTITEEGGFGQRNPFVLMLGFVEKLGYKYADEIVGTMPNLEEHVTGVLGYSRKVHCVPMGVDEDLFDSAERLSEEYRANHIPQEKFVVAHVGSIGITNALETFLECAQALQENSDIHFLVVGDGDLKAFYQSKYKLPNLTFGPRVPKTMVQSILAECDLLYFSVHSSKVWDYGQSLNKVIDYMLAGKPIVASYTGYPSMINEAGCGSYVPAGNMQALADEILRYAAMDSVRLDALGGKGREWLLDNRRYTVLAKQYLEIMLPAETTQLNTAQ